MADTVAQGPDDTGDDTKGAAHAAPSARDASHGPGAAPESIGRHHRGNASSFGAPADAVGRARAAARTSSHDAAPEPIGVVGGLMLLGAVALAVAAGKSGRKPAGAYARTDLRPK